VFDLSVSLGNILTLAGYLVGAIFFGLQLKAWVGILDIKLRMLQHDFAQRENDDRTRNTELHNILIILAKYEERFARLEELVNDLRRGRGYINKDD
jgi:hypothetical protein